MGDRPFKDPERAKASLWFFKTGSGQYGEGDVFLGMSVPEQRRISKKYLDLTLDELQEMLNNKIHEFRLIALFILVDKYKKGTDASAHSASSGLASSAFTRKEIVDFYLKNTKRVNNWDLVDSSAGYILGDYLYHKCHPELLNRHPEEATTSIGSQRRDSLASLQNDNNVKQVLYKLARSENIWERRIAIISTQAFIKNNQFNETLKIAEMLLMDKHDLIHKAVGWMLREVGNRDLKKLYVFLDKHYKVMPRTMLRYAIEKFEKEKREFYMRK